MLLAKYLISITAALKYKILAKKYRGVISHDPEDWCKIWRKTDLLFQKWQEFGEIWPEHSKVYKTCTFLCSYCAKHLMFDLKKYRWVIFHETKEGYKIWRGIDWSFQNWHKEFDKSLKNFHFNGLLLSKGILFELKIYRGVICQDNEEWYKNWIWTDLSFLNSQEQLLTRVLEKICFNWLLVTKVYNVWATKVQSYANFEENWLAVWKVT